MRIRKLLFIPLTVAMIGAMGCTGESNKTSKTETAVTTTQAEVSTTPQTEESITETVAEESITETVAEESITETIAEAEVSEAMTESSAMTALGLTEDEIFEKIRDHFYDQNPELVDNSAETEYAAWYPCDSEDSNVLKIAHRAYTGAFTYYYVDLTSGETYVTEYVSGILDEEQETGETFNIK